MKLSFLMMSRGRPDLFIRSTQSLLTNALNRDRVEIICRMDDDDDCLRAYAERAEKEVRFIVGPRMKGYWSFGPMLNECAEEAIGDLLFIWADDAVMKTYGYDVLYESTVRESGMSIFVLTSNTTSNVGGGDYPFSFLGIPRKLYRITEDYSLGVSIGIDRCYEALSQHLHCELRAKVDVYHEYQKDRTADEGRNTVDPVVNASRAEHFANWDRIGKEFADRIRVEA